MKRIIVEETKDKHIQVTLNLFNYKYQHFALIVCDIVRHIAKAYNVPEDDVWKWVNKERDNPTTEITGNTLNLN